MNLYIHIFLGLFFMLSFVDLDIGVGYQDTKDYPLVLSDIDFDSCNNGTQAMMCQIMGAGKSFKLNTYTGDSIFLDFQSVGEQLALSKIQVLSQLGKGDLPLGVNITNGMIVSQMSFNGHPQNETLRQNEVGVVNNFTGISSGVKEIRHSLFMQPGDDTREYFFSQKGGVSIVDSIPSAISKALFDKMHKKIKRNVQEHLEGINYTSGLNSHHADLDLEASISSALDTHHSFLLKQIGIYTSQTGNS